MAGSMIEHVSDTAFWVATFRAEEGARSKPLFSDPLAGRLAGERGPQIAASMKESKWTRWNVVLRTVIIDEYIRQAVREGVDTVMNLGAGLDTRPYRMELPNVRWIEVDFPHVIEFKEEKLAGEKPLVKLERMKADLSNANERGRVFDQVAASSNKVLVITEGVTPYLTEEDVSALGEGLGRHHQFVYWITDYHSPIFGEMYKQGRVLQQLKAKAPFRFFPKDWEGFYRSCGWKVKQNRFLSDVGRELKRPPPMPFIYFLMYPFIPKVKKDQIAKMSGYAILEPV
jgi:methyltransferase (TIGR00027 family)